LNASLSSTLAQANRRTRPSDSRGVRFFSPNPTEPLAGTWQMMCAPSPGAFQLPPPPANDSAATRAELAELRTLALNRSVSDLQQIVRWSVNEPTLASHWETLANLLARQYELSPPAAARVNYAMTSAMHAAIIAAWNMKYNYLRPRPSVLDPGVDATLIRVPDHPAYPSGHSTAAGAASTILSRFFPADAGVIEALAQDSGLSRLKAGIHYRTDHTGGLALGRQVARGVIENVVARDGGPQAYVRRPGTRALSFREFLTILDCQSATCLNGRR